MISVEDARAKLLALVAPLGSETLPLRLGAGRVLAKPALAMRDQPPFAASAMDGYAVVPGGDTPPALGTTWRVVGESAAGAGVSYRHWRG